MRKKSSLALLVLATFAAAVVSGIGASAAFAGEVTGNCNNAEQGSPAADNCKERQNANANSICSFSGQNDDPEAPGAEGGRVQSWGQDVKEAVHAGNPPPGGVPGLACRGGSN
jgi:hypothetical protein